jgi:hypothetical protein
MCRTREGEVRQTAPHVKCRSRARLTSTSCQAVLMCSQFRCSGRISDYECKLITEKESNGSGAGDRYETDDKDRMPYSVITTAASDHWKRTNKIFPTWTIKYNGVEYGSGKTHTVADELESNKDNGYWEGQAFVRLGFKCRN